MLPSRLVIDDRDNQKVVPVKLAGTADEEIFAADMPSQTLADGLVRLGNVGVAYGETEVRRVIMSAEVQD
ncbi:hypothetical protein BZG24_31380, partial [Escherichia coli]|nr:hypothetical protein [Escherichia coli]